MKPEKYIEGEELSADELETISEALIQAKFDREKRKAWEQKLKEKYGVEREVNDKKKKFPFSNLAIAAILACIAGIVAYSIILFSTPSYDNFVNESIEKLIMLDQHALVTRGDASINGKVSAAIKAYNTKDYDKSIVIWKQLTSSENIKGSAYYNLALCYLQKEPAALESAIENLSEARKHKMAQQEANWALALVYLQANEKGKAKEILAAIIEAKAYKYKRAEALIKLL